MFPTLILLAGVSTAALAAAEDGSRPDAEVIEQVEVMRVLLAKELNADLNDLWRETEQERARRQAGEVPSNVVGALLSDSLPEKTFQFTSNTRGFYAPGLGAWFSTEIPIQATWSDREEAEPGDAWEAARREVRGNPPTSFASAAQKVGQLDEASVEAAIRSVLDCMADYASNVAIAPGESLVVGLRFTQSSYGTTYGTTYRNFFHSLKGSGDLTRALALTRMSEGAGAVNPAHAVIRISAENIERLRDRQLTPQRFREHAEITRY